MKINGPQRAGGAGRVRVDDPQENWENVRSVAGRDQNRHFFLGKNSTLGPQSTVATAQHVETACLGLFWFAKGTGDVWPLPLTTKVISQKSEFCY